MSDRRSSITGVCAYLAHNLAQDVGFAFRQLRRSPALTIAVVLSLGLAIGANTAVFTLIDTIMWKKLPVRQPDRLVLLSWTSQQRPAMMARQTGNVNIETGRWMSPSLPYPSLKEFRTHNDVFSCLFGFAPLGKATINIDGQASLGDGELVTGHYFPCLGVGTIMGRGIADEDERPSAPRVAVISYSYWSLHFGRSPAAVGKAIAINRTPFTIIGVAQPRFYGVQLGRSVDLWVPLVEDSHLLPWGSSTPGGRSPFTSRDWWWLMMIGRLNAGVTQRQATADMEVLFQQTINAGRREPSKPEYTPHIQLDPAGKGLAVLRNEFSNPLWVLMILVAAVLLVACANVATLLVARSTARQKEFAVRIALGAGRSRLTRQLMTEAMTLAILGGALGLLFARWGSDMLVLLISQGQESIKLDVRIDVWVLGFTAIVSLGTAILFGLTPALRSTRVDLLSALKVGAGTVSVATQRSRFGLGKSLVTLQVGLSLALLIVAGLFIGTLRNLLGQNLGFDPRHLLLFHLDPTKNGYSGQRLIEFYGQLLTRLQSVPGVKSATASTEALIANSSSHVPIVIEGSKLGPENMGSDLNSVGPNFFETMGIPLLSGRGIESRDSISSLNVAVVNRAFSHHFFEGQNPIGHRFKLEGFADRDYDIVGVVGDAKYANLRDGPLPTIYLPYTQMPVPVEDLNFEVRTTADPVALVPMVSHTLHDLDSDLALSEVKTQVQQIDENLLQERLFARLCEFFGALALLLACVGLHGLMAFIGAQRAGEMGIRLALGAERRTILVSVMKETFAMVALGVALGILLALASSRLFESFLYGLRATDPFTISICAFAMMVAAVLASYSPAWRASRIDPMITLRYE